MDNSRKLGCVRSLAPYGRGSSNPWLIREINKNFGKRNRERQGESSESQKAVQPAVLGKRVNF